MVHFVGAGPGAADLITLRGKSLLEQADVIIYAGSLVNPELLSFAKSGCKIFDSSKMTLDEVAAAFRDFKDKAVVRLHTGDPCLYGAIREQMDRLEEMNIDFEICPGVSSFCGVAAALKAEYTLPEVSQTVIITRAAGKTGVPDRESIVSLAAHGSTMAIFLSAGLLEAVSCDLISGGYAPDTPAAIVYKATWPDEIVVRGTVSGLCEMAKSNNITKTAMIVVGDFLGSDYALSRLYANDFSTEFREAKI